jgi:uncharacterized membrane protein
MKISHANGNSLYLKPETVFLICSLIFGLFFVIATPPLQAPDGKAHFARALQVSSGNFYHGSFVDEIPFGITDYWSQRFENVQINKIKLSWPKLKAYLLSDASSLQNSQRHFCRTPAFVYHPISYLSSGAGIALSRFFNLPSILSLYMGRLMNLLVWIFLSWTGLRIIPFFKWESMFLMLLPMSLFMGSSISADSFNNAVCFLLICSIFSLLYNSKENLSPGILGLITACTFAAACGKQIYALLFYLICFAYNQFKTRRFFWLYIAGTSFLIILGGSWVLLNPTPTAIDSNTAFQQLTQTFFTPLKILLFTLGHYHRTYLEQFIGVLGWLDTFGQEFIYVMYTAILILILPVMCTTSHKIPRLLRFTAAVLILFYVSTLILTLYLVWHSSIPFICDGVQGRYFIPFMLLVPFVFAKTVPAAIEGQRTVVSSVLEYMQQPARFILVLATVIGLTSFCFALSSRYYYDESNKNTQTTLIQNISNWHCNEIIKDRKIRQNFISPALKLNKINLFFATYMRTNTGILKLEIIDPDTENIISSVDDSMQEIKDNSWHTFNFHDARLVPGKMYAMQLSAPEASHGNAITWYGSRTDVYANNEASINGKPIPGDFTFSMTFDNPSLLR